ncbi:VOC family protein [uncultured Roseobacter sp.]|uniref:VOC family protein n=1 Tax=uncultured Roseobacter sp. TaxID=114847 RepID=UPI002637441F|nr:VOC family protein [uncultured Roseobacter sp.]
MQKVTGIGGLFFRADDPKATSAWYAEHLGISEVPVTYEADAWQQQAGPTVFAPFAADTEYFGNAAKSWMLNLRVDDLDAMVSQLRAAGIDVEVDAKRYPNGRFARLTDPEGNPIELWQPMAAEDAE